MVELVNFILRSAGCTIEVDENDILDVDNVASKLSDIQDEFQAVRLVLNPANRHALTDTTSSKTSQTIRSLPARSRPTHSAPTSLDSSMS